MGSILDNLTSWLNPWSENFILKVAFVPSDDDMVANKDILFNALNSKLQFIENFKTAFHNFSTAGQPLSFPISFGKFYEGTINLNWYEPYRLQIRSGVSAVFYVSMFLSLFGLISNVFGISVGKATQMSVKNGGGNTD